MTDTTAAHQQTAETAAGTWPSADPALDALFLEVIGTEEGRRDPYGRYRQLREAAPVYRSGLGMTICTRYEECQWVLRHPSFGKDEATSDERARARFGDLEIFPQIMEFFSERRSILFLNPPDHTRLRSLISRAFTPRTVEALRPEILELVDSLLDQIPLGETTDVMSALAFKLPANVISAMLGVPESDWPRFRTVVSAASSLLEPTIAPAELERALQAQVELDEYFRELIGERRKQPGDDLISTLIAVQEGTDRLSENELISTVILVFAAGFETTTNLIGNGLYALLTHRDQLDRLRADIAGASDPNEPMRPAVEELLRWDSPVQFDGRQAFSDVEIAGVPVAAGEEVITILGAANRDPAHYTEPERFDLHRDEGPPMSFAAGIHLCLGAPLARAEGQITFRRLLERFPTIELATDEPPWKDRITLRGLAELPVHFDA